jgi:hypothetical protein
MYPGLCEIFIEVGLGEGVDLGVGEGVGLIAIFGLVLGEGTFILYK